MLEAKKILIEQYHLKELGYDFMGYVLEKGDIFTLHHFIVPARKGGKANIDNGTILCGNTAHPYIHLIEKKDKKIFDLISFEMLEMKKKGYIDLINLENINELLCEFESEHSEDENDIGKKIIKPEYKIRILKRKF